MKIERVVLKEMEIVEVDGQFIQVFKNEKTVPCFITNHSMKRGKDMGLISGSLIADLFKLEGLKNKNANDTEANGDIQTKGVSEALNSMDETEMQKVIYLGCLGANRNLDMDFDKFLEKFHYPFEKTMELYMNLIKNLVSSDPNQFAKGLQKSTKKGKKQ